MDMTEDIFARYSYGKAALKKIKEAGTLPLNFRLYEAEWLGDEKCMRQVMKVTGAEFRTAKSGINKGKLSIIVKGTERSVYVTVNEMNAYDVE